MTAKEKIIRAVEGLPANATMEEAMGRLFLFYKVERGLQEIETGKWVSHSEAKARMQHWLS